MKKVPLIILGLIFIATSAWSEPFIISDPYDPDCGSSGHTICPTKAELYDNGNLMVTVDLEDDMSIRHDLTGWPDGEHSYTGRYLDEHGRGGPMSDPFVLLAQPSVLEGLNMEF
jgi:hypothetical protein